MTIKEFSMHEMDLPQIGRIGIAAFVRAVLNGFPRMGIALNAVAGNHGDTITNGLDYIMVGV